MFPWWTFFTLQALELSHAAKELQKTLSEMTELLGSLQLACFVQPYIQTTQDNMGNAIKVLGVMHPRSSLVVF